MSTGTIVQVVGPVVDVEFPGALPAIHNALSIECTVQNRPMKVTLEVQQHLGDRRVRAVAMSGTEGLSAATKCATAAVRSTCRWDRA